MECYQVWGGGIYRYCYNTRTGRGRWLSRKVECKKTEKELFTEERAAGIIAANNSGYIRMGGAKMVKIEGLA